MTPERATERSGKGGGGKGKRCVQFEEELSVSV